MTATRMLVIGLDGLSPDIVESHVAALPHLRRVMEAGIWGPLESIVQPVTPAAWVAMTSGRDPGHFGFTDFLHRVGASYTEFKLVHSRLIRVPTLYTWLPAAGRHVVMLNVPVTYPPVAIPGGVCVSCFMAPAVERGITTPPGLQAELLAQTSSPYLLDVALTEGAAEVDRGGLLQRIREMDRQRFDIAGYLMRTTPWDLLFMVCMGTDRVGHYFMRYHDPQHGRFDPDPRYRDAIVEHYRYCDERIGGLLELAGPDATVMVVSDHGVQRLDAKLHLNDWLAANGYLHLSGPVDGPTPLSKAPIDWGRTRAWARGYGGQIYLNVRGREPEGCVDPADADALLAELERSLQRLTGPDGRRLAVEAIRRGDLYSGPEAGRCPDLFVQIDGLRTLTSDAVGHRVLITPVTDLGPDDASHARAGFLAMSGPTVPRLGRFTAMHLLDVAPTILDVLGAPIPPDLEGRPLHKVDAVYSVEEEAALTGRLRALYLE